MQNHNVKFKLSIIDIQYEEFVCFFIVISPAILIENVLRLVIIQSEVLETNVLFKLPCLVQLNASINLLSKGIHLIWRF